MSKLSKLLANPKRFAADSKLYRRFALVARKGIGLTRENRLSSWAPLGRGEQLAHEVVEEIARHMPMLDLSWGPFVEIGVLEADSYCISDFLCNLQNSRTADIILESGRNSLPLRDEKLFVIDEFVHGATSVRARMKFSEDRDLEVVFQYWKDDGAQMVGTKAARLARRISHRDIKKYGFFEQGVAKSARALHRCPLVLEPDFPVDVVYTWVNHADPGWRALRARAAGTSVAAANSTGDAAGLERFLNRDELRYSIRSVARYAPWVRNIYVVTNCAAPQWLDVTNPRVTWVDHEQIIPREALPTFNSHAIESRLQHIPGLSNYFLYFNDDFFLTRPTTASDFFFCNGTSKSFMEDYGTVNGDVHAGDPDYLNAARNGKALLEEAFQRSVTSLHKHTPYSLRKDVLLELEDRFRVPIGNTTRHQYRMATDISTVSFLYHHFAYLTNRGIYTPSDAVLIKPRSPNYRKRLANLLEPRKRPVSICLNDGAGSAKEPHWGQHVVEFLEALFPRPCEFEN